jgi:hypothetical protein
MYLGLFAWRMGCGEERERGEDVQSTAGERAPLAGLALAEEYMAEQCLYRGLGLGCGGSASCARMRCGEGVWDP